MKWNTYFNFLLVIACWQPSFYFWGFLLSGKELKMSNLLQVRDTNVQKTQNSTVYKSGAKHKISIDEDEGPPKQKRQTMSVITEAFSTTIIDSTKKTQIEDLSSLAEQEAIQGDVAPIDVTVDPMPGLHFDKEQMREPFAVSEYAFDIFRYLKFREQDFRVQYYYANQQSFDKYMRAALVDWIWELQQAFELLNETIYIAVKVLDLYFSKTPPHTLAKPKVQLIACVAVFIASKMEEQSAPLLEDLLNLCQNAYSVAQLKEMERQMLRTIGFDLGMPLSYSFLRRYSRVINCPMPVLTTARYYLELSLHRLKFCIESESKMAAACLLLALLATGTGDWNPTLEKYSGYKVDDIHDLMFEVNHAVRRFKRDFKDLTCVIEKYSDLTFFEVALQPMLDDHLFGPVE